MKHPHSTRPPANETDSATASAIRTTLGLLPVLAISTGMAAPVAAQTTDTVELDPIILQGGTGNTPATSYSVDNSGSQKVLTPLLTTPQSIRVITRRELSERGLTSLTDVLRATPGITLGTGEGGNPAGVQPTIRGNSAANDIMVDGFRSPLRTEYDAFNLETVEVRKGAGGSASGTGSTGGTINLTTKTPADENFADTSLSFGTGEYKRATVDVNRVFGDFGARLNLMYQDADSLGGRDGRTSDRYGIAPSISYKFSDATKVTAGLYYLKDEDLLDYGVPLTNATVPTQYGRGTGTVDDPFRPVDVPTDSYYGLHDRDFHEATTRSGFVRVEHEFSPNLRLSTALRKTDNDNAYVVSLPNGSALGVTRDARSSDREGDDIALNSQLTGEANLWGLKHTFAFGIDIANTEMRTNAITITNPVGWNGTTPYINPDPSTPWAGTIVRGDTTAITKYKTRGIYAFDVIDFNPQWQASFGLRYDSYSADSLTGIGTAPVTNENKSNFWNGSVGIVYKPTDSSSVYASVGTSTNPAGEGNGVGAAANSTLDELEPERAYNYEIGTKWSVFDDKLLLTAALFRTTKDNARQTNEFGETDNIGKTRSQGFELTAAGQINDRWGISAGYAYTDAKIVDGGYSCTGTPAVCTPSTNNGSAVTGVPRHALSLWSTYAVNDQLTVGGGAYFIGERMLNATRTAVLPSQVRIDLMASYRFNEDTSVQFNANNIFDEQLYSGNRGNGWANVEAGRNFTLTLNHSF